MVPRFPSEPRCGSLPLQFALGNLYDTFVKGASRIVVTNNRANVLSSAEVTLPDGEVDTARHGSLLSN